MSTKKRISYISSRFETVNKYNFNANFHNHLQRCGQIVVTDAVIPNTIYNIRTDYNDEFIFTLDAVQHSINLSAGYYVRSTGADNDILDALQTLLTAIDANLTLSVSPTTFKFTLTHTTATITINGGSMNRVVGFVENDTGALTVTASNILDLSGVRNVFIKVNISPLTKRFINNYSSLSNKLDHIIAIIPMKESFGNIVHYTHDSDDLRSTTFENLHNLSNIPVQLVDEEGNELDFNGADWSVTLQSYFL